MVRFHAFINAYKKENDSYTYWQDDGTEVTLVAGQDGVTEEWIAKLKVWHREERNSMRHGEGKVISLEAFCEEMDDHSEVLLDTYCDPEMTFISDMDKMAYQQKFRKALATLSSEQREILRRARILGEPVSAIARELGIHESSLRERIQRMQKSLKKLL